MQGLEDHYFRFTSDELFNGLPAQLVDKWSAWGIKAAVGYKSSSSVLKFLPLIMLSRTGTTPNRADLIESTTPCHDAQMVGSYRVSSPLCLTVLASESEDYATVPQNLSEGVVLLLRGSWVIRHPRYILGNHSVILHSTFRGSLPPVLRTLVTALSTLFTLEPNPCINESL